jgi:hypothetical protein
MQSGVIAVCKLALQDVPAKTRSRARFPPLTPALSPMRGEGARPASSVLGTQLAAFAAVGSIDKRAGTRRRALKPRHTLDATPSPLNGESAGVRGEAVSASLTPPDGPHCEGI